MNEERDSSAPEMIGGRFRVERELGHGGMATVFLCSDTESGEQVAVKVLRPELGALLVPCHAAGGPALCQTGNRTAETR